MTGDDFLKLAGLLFAPYQTREKSASEALARTIINRSYYGAHHLAVAFLTSLGFPTSRHGTPNDLLVDSGHPEAKKAGRLLADLYEARQRADYRLNDPKAIREASEANYVEDQVESAKKVKSILEQCDLEPTRSAVKAGIEAYRQRTGNSPRK